MKIRKVTIGNNNIFSDRTTEPDLRPKLIPSVIIQNTASSKQRSIKKSHRRPAHNYKEYHREVQSMTRLEQISMMQKHLQKCVSDWR